MQSRYISGLIAVTVCASAGLMADVSASASELAPSGQILSFTLLTPMHNADLQAKMVAQRSIVSPSRYQELFGSTSDEVRRAKNWAKRNHLHVNYSSPSSGQIFVSASVRDLSSALHVRVAKVRRHGNDGFAVLGTPISVEESVIGVSGLNSTVRAASTAKLQPNSLRKDVGPSNGSPACAPHWGDNLYPSALKYSRESNVLCGYAPADISSMYKATPLQKYDPSVGIVLWGNDPNVKSLTNDYMAKVNFPLLNGYTATVASPDSDMVNCDLRGRNLNRRFRSKLSTQCPLDRRFSIMVHQVVSRRQFN